MILSVAYLTLAERNFADEVLKFLVADVIAHRVRRQENFNRYATSLFIRAWHELLHDDGVEAQRELLFNLRLLRGREDIDDAVDRLRGVAGV